MMNINYLQENSGNVFNWKFLQLIGPQGLATECVDWSFVKRKTLLGHRPVSEKADFVKHNLQHFTLVMHSVKCNAQCKVQVTLVKCDLHL